MRPREAVLIALLLFTSLWGLMHGPLHVWRGTAVVLFVLLLHLFQEGAHWQMMPAYVGCGLVVLAFAMNLPFLLIAAIISAGVTIGLSSVLPMFRFAPLTGLFPVATRVVHLTDKTRIEDAGKTATGYREVVVQLWYPTACQKGRRASYRTRAETTLLSSYQRVLPTRAYVNLPPAGDEQAFPVILFSPAWNGRRTQSTFLTAELASHGFVVAAVDHPYNSDPVALGDGTVVRGIREPAMENIPSSTARDIQQIGEREVDKQSIDCLFVLDELERMNQATGSCWTGRIDTTRVAAVGHSIGGAVAVECWARDERVGAAINFDGWTLGSKSNSVDRVERGNRMPLLFVYEGGRGSPEELLRATPMDVEQEVDAADTAKVLRLIDRYGGMWLTLRDSSHVDFTDKILTSPLKRLSGRGKLRPRQVHRAIQTLTLAFLHAALDTGDSFPVDLAKDETVSVRHMCPPGRSL